MLSQSSKSQHLQRKKVSANSQVVSTILWRVKALCAPLGPSGVLDRGQGSPSSAFQAQRITSSGETHVCQPSEEESKNRSFIARVSWFDRVHLTPAALRVDRISLRRRIIWRLRCTPTRVIFLAWLKTSVIESGLTVSLTTQSFLTSSTACRTRLPCCILHNCALSHFPLALQSDLPLLDRQTDLF